MGLHPNVVAVFAALVFGIVIFPWQTVVRSVGPAGFFLFVGISYLVVGLGYYAMHGFFAPLTWSVAGLAFLVGALYICATVCCNYAIAHPQANVSVISAIVAGYPAITVLVAYGLLGQRLNLKELFFLCTAMGSIIALSLSGKH